MHIVKKTLHIIKKMVLIVLLVIVGTYASLWIWNYFVTPAPISEIKHGVTFSKLYAEQLGLSWELAYRDILNDLGVKKIRLPAYWQEIEPEPDKFTFGELDLQISEAHKRDVKLILAVGMRVPRWPECHFPDWVKELSQDEQEERLLKYLEKIVTRYSRHPAIEYLQIENEPFLEGFGICPPPNAKLLDKEVALTKLHSDKPILTTDGGEFGDWMRARKRGDIFGTTMYRVIFNERSGYFKYPLPPTYFTFKNFITGILSKNNTAIVIELQGEAWGPKPIQYLPLDEQLRQFDFEDFKETLIYARKTGFPEIYVWGVEWWYWMKETQDDDRFWEEAKTLFNN